MLPFKAKDITLILGLLCDGDIVSFKHESVQSKFDQTFLNKMHNQHHDAIKENLFELVHIKDGVEETFVKLLVVYDDHLLPLCLTKCANIDNKIH